MWELHCARGAVAFISQLREQRIALDEDGLSASRMQAEEYEASLEAGVLRERLAVLAPLAVQPPVSRKWAKLK